MSKLSRKRWLVRTRENTARGTAIQISGLAVRDAIFQVLYNNSIYSQPCIFLADQDFGSGLKDLYKRYCAIIFAVLDHSVTGGAERFYQQSTNINSVSTRVDIFVFTVMSLMFSQSACLLMLF